MSRPTRQHPTRQFLLSLLLLSGSEAFLPSGGLRTSCISRRPSSGGVVGLPAQTNAFGEDEAEAGEEAAAAAAADGEEVELKSSSSSSSSSSPAELEATLSSSLTSRMRQLGLDPTTERLAASVRVEESAAVILDANEVKRRYYEEFFKARALRGIKPTVEAPTGAVASASSSSSSSSSPSVSSAFSTTTATTSSSSPPSSSTSSSSALPSGAFELPRGSWYKEAEARHGRTAMLACLYWATGRVAFPQTAAQSLQHASDHAYSAASSYVESTTELALNANLNLPAFQAWLPLPDIPVLADDLFTGHIPQWEVAALSAVLAVAVAREAAALASSQWSFPSSSSSSSEAATASPQELLFSLASAFRPALWTGGDGEQKVGSSGDSAVAEGSFQERFQRRLRASEAIHGRVAMTIWAPVLHAYATTALFPAAAVATDMATTAASTGGVPGL